MTDTKQLRELVDGLPVNAHPSIVVKVHVDTLRDLLRVYEAWQAAPVGRLEDVVDRLHYIHFDGAENQQKVAPMAAASQTVRLVDAAIAAGEAGNG